DDRRRDVRDARQQFVLRLCFLELVPLQPAAEPGERDAEHSEECDVHRIGVHQRTAEDHAEDRREDSRAGPSAERRGKDGDEEKKEGDWLEEGAERPLNQGSNQRQSCRNEISKGRGPHGMWKCTAKRTVQPKQHVLELPKSKTQNAERRIEN